MADEKRPETEQDDDSQMHAADEPTAVWDANTLRDAGLGDLLRRPESEPPPAQTSPKKFGNQDPSIVVDAAAAGAKAEVVRRAARRRSNSGELGWAATVGLAAGLGAAVYLLIRFLR